MGCVRVTAAELFGLVTAASHAIGALHRLLFCWGFPLTLLTALRDPAPFSWRCQPAWSWASLLRWPLGRAAHGRAACAACPRPLMDSHVRRPVATIRLERIPPMNRARLVAQRKRTWRARRERRCLLRALRGLHRLRGLHHSRGRHRLPGKRARRFQSESWHLDRNV